MAEPKAAAVGRDMLDRPLGEISAAEFLNVLYEARLPAEVAAVLPDKKKYELWVDENIVVKIPVGRVLDFIRREKKKLELEKRLVIENIPKRVGEFELPQKPFEVFDRESLVTEIVGEVMKKIGRQ